MSRDLDSEDLLDEFAEFFASQPSREALLSYQLPPAVVQRAVDLLDRASAGQLTEKDAWDLQQFEQMELLMRLIKARLQEVA
ncbi:MAG: hypothetical protein SH850_06835 [Planctomycetaceae bacterium]|nr:hypothetical protein [Planctomycetaceae bacterium]